MKEIWAELAALIPGSTRETVQDDGLKTFLVQGSVASFSLRIASTGLGFITSIFLARLLRAEGYGIYSYALSWALLLSVFAVMGFDKLIVRYLAVYQAEQQWGHMHGMIKRTDQAVLLLSTVLAVAAVVITWSLMTIETTAMRNALVIAFLVLPLYSFIRLKQSALQGMHEVVKGQVPEMIFQPILFLMLLMGAYFLPGRSISAEHAVLLFVMTAACTLVVLTCMVRRSLPGEATAAEPVFETGAWLKTALPLLCIDSMYIINSRTDIIMLGAMKGAVPAGIYNVANRGAEFITFVLVSVNMVLAPTIAALHAQGDKERLQNILTLSARAVLLFSLPVALGLVIFGKDFLTIFGGDFIPGDWALSILSMAQLFNCAMGSVGLLLIMTGHQKQAAIGVAVSAVLNIALNVVLIPLWGIEGAAVATGVSMITWNALYVVWVYKKLGYHTTALGKIDWLVKN